MAGRKGVPLLDRLLARIDASGDCWEWTKTVNNGYGIFNYIDAEIGKVHSRPVHRLLYSMLVGPVPEDLDLDHLCRNRRCCNPDHLEPVTRAENLARGAGPVILRALKAALTECANGHPFTDDNTIVGKRGWRSCRKCQRASDARSRARRKEVNA